MKFKKYGEKSILFNEDVDEVLDLMIKKNKRVQCVVTSPPYYAKRVYGSEKQFGGEPECEHEWEEIKTSRLNLSGGKTEKQSTNNGSFAVDYNDRNVYSKKCKKCNAWIGELGQEPTVEEYVNNLCDIFDKVYKVLSDDGIVFVNISDTYIDKGRQRKGLYLVPERFKIEMQSRGWLCRSKIIWHVINKMPLSLQDRFLDDYEDVIIFVKTPKYKFNQQYENVESGKRIKRCVISTRNGASTISNTASYPTELIEPLLLSATNEGDIVMDIFSGAGSTGIACDSLKREYIGIEINEEIYKTSLENLMILD